MSKIVWDQVGERLYETGVEKGVLFPCPGGVYSKGVAWNGLTSVSESPSGAEPTALYADDIKYLNLMSAEEFGATIEAYTYPDEFKPCDGSAAIATGVTIGQQKRIPFGMTYTTKLGNDVEGSDYGYKIHLIYGALASPSEKAYATTNETPEAITLSWSITTTPVKIANKNFKPTAHVIIDSTLVDEDELKAFEDIIYGFDAPAFSTTSTYAVGDVVTYESKIYKCATAVATAGEWNSNNWTEITTGNEPRLPLPDELTQIFSTTEISG